MKHLKFNKGQRVKQIDPDDGVLAYGTITEVRVSSLMIEWDDLSEPTEHFEDEYDSIFDGQSKMK